MFDIYKINSYKGYYGLQKAKVTRIDDPENKNRIQVYIPLYQGEFDVNRQGIGSSLGSYFWAQMCTTIFKNKSDDDTNVLSNYVNNDVLSVVYPEVGDIVWVLFEGGDYRTPVYMGSLNAFLNSNKKDLDLSCKYKGGTIIDITLNILKSNLSYDNISTNLDGQVFVGMLNWHGDGIRNLINDIKNKNTLYFNSVLTNQPNFLNMLISSKSWSNIKIEGDLKNKLKVLLNSDISRSIQDEVTIEIIKTNIKMLWTLGITKIDVLIYLVCMIIITGESYSSIITNCKNDIDILHNIITIIFADTTYILKFNSIYDTLVNMKRNGDLDKDTEVENNNTQEENNTELLWFVPDCNNITRNYDEGEEFFCGIEVSNDNIYNKKIIASHSGTATYKFDYESTLHKGKYVSIIDDSDPNNIVETQYCHLSKCSFTDVVNNTKQVNAGDIIGYVGQTGLVNKPTVLFILLINGVPVNPIDYF